MQSLHPRQPADTHTECTVCEALALSLALARRQLAAAAGAARAAGHGGAHLPAEPGGAARGGRKGGRGGKAGPGVRAGWRVGRLVGDGLARGRAGGAAGVPQCSRSPPSAPLGPSPGDVCLCCLGLSEAGARSVPALPPLHCSRPVVGASGSTRPVMPAAPSQTIFPPKNNIPPQTWQVADLMGRGPALYTVLPHPRKASHPPTKQEHHTHPSLEQHPTRAAQSQQVADLMGRNPASLSTTEDEAEHQRWRKALEVSRSAFTHPVLEILEILEIPRISASTSAGARLWR